MGRGALSRGSVGGEEERPCLRWAARCAARRTRGLVLRWRRRLFLLLAFTADFKIDARVGDR